MLIIIYECTCTLASECVCVCVIVWFNVRSSFYYFSIGSAVHTHLDRIVVAVFFHANLFVIVTDIATATLNSSFHFSNEIHEHFGNTNMHMYRTNKVCLCMDRTVIYSTYIFIIIIIIINHCHQINKLWLTKVGRRNHTRDYFDFNNRKKSNTLKIST